MFRESHKYNCKLLGTQMQSIEHNCKIEENVLNTQLITILENNINSKH